MDMAFNVIRRLNEAEILHPVRFMYGYCAGVDGVLLPSFSFFISFCFTHYGATNSYNIVLLFISPPLYQFLSLDKCTL